MDLSSNNVAILKDTVFGPLTETALLEGSKIYLGGKIENKLITPFQ